MNNDFYTQITELHLKKIKSIHQEDLLCSQCNIPVQDTGIILCSYPEQYQYKCPNCQKIIISHISYPHLIYEYEDKNDV